MVFPQTVLPGGKKGSKASQGGELRAAVQRNQANPDLARQALGLRAQKVLDDAIQGGVGALRHAAQGQE